MTLVLSDNDVQRLLSMEECIEAMEAAFRDYANATAVNIPRIRYQCPSANPEYAYSSNIHIGAVSSCNTAAVRIGGRSRRIEPAKTGVGAPGPQYDNRNWGFICLTSLETGELLAILHEFVLSGIRVGATSALAAKYLAPEGATTLGLFGSGKLARTDLEGLAIVRPLQHVKVFSPTREHRERFAREMSAKLEIEVTAVDEPREVVRGVDIICCATNAGYVTGEPVFDGQWLEPGQLVISLQNSDPNFLKSEVDETTFVRSDSICINDKESVYANNQRELLDPIERGLFGWEKVYELADIVGGKLAGRRDASDVIYYKNSTGMGIQMAAAGAVIYNNAVREGLGQPIPSEWFGSDLSDWYAKGYHPSA